MTPEPTDRDRSALVVPFVMTRGNGGPHEDLSFASGWRLGAVFASLGLVAAMDPMEPVTTSLRCGELRQADLIAMRHGFTCTDYPICVVDEFGMPSHDWHKVTFRRVQEDLSQPPS